MCNDDVVEGVVMVWAWAQIKECTHHVQIYGKNVYLVLLQDVTNQGVSRGPPFAVEVLVALLDDDFAHTLHADTERVVQRENDVLHMSAQPLPVISHEEEYVCVEHVAHKSGKLGWQRQVVVDKELASEDNASLRFLARLLSLTCLPCLGARHMHGYGEIDVVKKLFHFRCSILSAQRY